MIIKRYSRVKILFFSIVLFFSVFPLSAQSGETLISGPIFSKNYYLPHLPVYSFQGFSPRSGEAGDGSYSASFVSINEFMAYNEEDIAVDYESSILELSWEYRPVDNLLLGVEGRIISYYGGIFDSVIESFHSLFGFDNAGREYFGNDNLLIDVDNTYGYNLELNENTIAPGDTDLYGVWTFYERSTLYLALAGAIKLPTGNLDDCTGSEWVDLGAQFLLEWVFTPHFSLHFQQGVVVPTDWIGSALWDITSYAESPVLQNLTGIQYTPRSDLSLLAQFRINTSPISSEKQRIHKLFDVVNFWSLPQTSLLVGVKKAFGPWMMQFYIEEDTITYEGVDILAGIRLYRAL